MPSNSLWFLLLINIRISILDVEVTSGVYIEKLPNISFYQASRQIVFRLNKPPNILEKLKCEKIFCAKYLQFCTMIMPKLNYFDTIQDNTVSNTNGDILLSDGELFDFQLATRSHLKKIFSNDYEIHRLVNRFNERDYVQVREINFPSFIDTTTYNASCTDSSLLSLVLMELNLQYQLSRSIVNMCQLKRLSIDLIPISDLEQLLKSINVTLSKGDYVLALDTTSQLYMMPLVECIMSKNVILVGLHLPLLQRQLQGLHTMQILTPAFAWDNYTCSVNVPVTNVALLQVNTSWKILIPKCDPIREELCFISDYRNEEILGLSCIQQILQGGSFKQIATNCPMSCKETGHNQQYITPVNSHRTLVTHAKKSLRLKCPTTTHQLDEHVEIGAITLAVPCNCQFEDDDSTIYPTYPCVDKSVKFSINQLVPAAWIQYTGLTLPTWQERVLRFDTLQDCLNKKWITNQFPDANIPVTTYLFIFLFILILLLPLPSMYLFYKFRTFNPFTTSRTVTRIPEVIPMITPPAQNRQPPPRQRLPQPRWNNTSPTDQDYLQPREHPLPHPNVHVNVSPTEEESQYISIDTFINK